MMTYFGIGERKQDAQREETEQWSADDAKDGDGRLSVEHSSSLSSHTPALWTLHPSYWRCCQTIITIQQLLFSNSYQAKHLAVNSDTLSRPFLMTC